MAAALMLMVVSGIFVTSWVTLMSTRASQVSYLENVCQRHIGLESSRLLAWQCMTSKAFDPNNSLASGQNTILGTDIGSLSTGTGWNSLNVYTSANTVGFLIYAITPSVKDAAAIMAQIMVAVCMIFS